MAVLHEFRRRSRHVVVPVLGACVIGYFVYHTVQGDRGLLAYMRLSGEVARAEAVLADARAERMRLEHKVNLLDGDSLDLDMLEERARDVLNRVRDDEIVVFMPVEG
ncbi:septum formation initiator family protein [Marivibrio halodurans]|uniref:Septum formation initiator family protein n=1 Tax=Marivibrio halodurans TaxID=2039722 RepID=A0A8J7V2A7_9PROT|nr:septum formation initiator family protein [Marivibrio halodurans]MBP5855559.1 septum formation initiator family protein [Marivibrio halodurans]